MFPMKVVLRDEKRHCKHTGDLAVFKSLRKVRSIWLQSSYLALQTMVRKCYNTFCLLNFMNYLFTGTGVHNKCNISTYQIRLEATEKTKVSI